MYQCRCRARTRQFSFKYYENKMIYKNVKRRNSKRMWTEKKNNEIYKYEINGGKKKNIYKIIMIIVDEEKKTINIYLEIGNNNNDSETRKRIPEK